jgi:hypothetical protein
MNGTSGVLPGGESEGESVDPGEVGSGGGIATLNGPTGVIPKGEGGGEDTNQEGVGSEEGSTIADGPVGVAEGVLGIKVAVRPSVLMLARNDGGRYFGVLAESRMHLYPEAGGGGVKLKVSRFGMMGMDLPQ